jgi:ABC-type Fe3+ transport system permease subunit
MAGARAAGGTGEHAGRGGGIAALVTVAAALFLVYGIRLAGRGTARAVLPLTTLGYATPVRGAGGGAVCSRWPRWTTGWPTGFRR